MADKSKRTKPKAAKKKRAKKKAATKKPPIQDSASKEAASCARPESDADHSARADARPSRPIEERWADLPVRSPAQVHSATRWRRLVVHSRMVGGGASTQILLLAADLIRSSAEFEPPGLARLAAQAARFLLDTEAVGVEDWEARELADDQARWVYEHLSIQEARDHLANAIYIATRESDERARTIACIALAALALLEPVVAIDPRARLREALTDAPAIEGTCPPLPGEPKPPPPSPPRRRRLIQTPSARRVLSLVFSEGIADEGLATTLPLIVSGALTYPRDERELITSLTAALGRAGMGLREGLWIYVHGGQLHVQVRRPEDTQVIEVPPRLVEFVTALGLEGKARLASRDRTHLKDKLCARQLDQVNTLISNVKGSKHAATQTYEYVAPALVGRVVPVHPDRGATP